MRTAHPIALKNLKGIYPLSYFPPDYILGKLCQEFLAILFVKFLNPISPVEPSVWHILEMIGQIDLK